MASNRDSSIPSFLIPQDGPLINLSITGTDALVEDQGYTYNQAGFTYNQAGVRYGGIYNTNEDIIPMMLSTSFITPHMSIFEDITGSSGVQGYSTGPGFFMLITHPLRLGA